MGVLEADESSRRQKDFSKKLCSAPFNIEWNFHSNWFKEKFQISKTPKAIELLLTFCGS